MNTKNCNCINGIICDATKCVYNESKKCTASQIEIGGCEACDSCETDCKTFKTE